MASSSRIVIVLAVASAVFPSAVARAEQHCLESETPRQCLQRMNMERAASAAEAVPATVTTGVNVPTSPARSALKDFLTVASSQLSTSTLTENPDESLAFAYNLPLDLLGTGRQVRLETVFTKPQLSSSVQSVAGVQAPALEKSLSAADDVLFDLSFNQMSRRFGRRVAPHRQLLGSLFTPGEPAGELFPGAAATLNPDTPFDAIAADPPGRAAAMAAFETTAAGALPSDVQKAAEAVGALLSNQPQLFATSTYRLRKDLVGQRIWSAAVTWEIGSRNLNSFYANEGRDCELTRRCAAALDHYMTRTAHNRAPGRLALSVEYDRKLGNRPNIPSAEVASLFVVPKAAGFSYAAVYGQPFASLLTGKEGRLDFTVTFDGTSVQKNLGTSVPANLRTSAVAQAFGRVSPPQAVPAPRDRSTIGATYTQHLSDRLSVPVSLIWSDHIVTTPGACVTLIISPEQPVVCRPATTRSQRAAAVQVGIIYRIPSVAPPRPRDCCCR